MLAKSIGKKEKKCFIQREKKRDEWDTLLDRSKLCSTLQVTAWALRFKHKSLTKRQKTKKRTGPLKTEELSYAKDQWIRKEQTGVQPDIKSPGWKLIREENTSIFKCKGRIPGYQPTYIAGGVFADKLIRHIHKNINNLGVASTMAAVREEWWIPQLRSKVKQTVNSCYLCKVFSTRPYVPYARMIALQSPITHLCFLFLNLDVIIITIRAPNQKIGQLPRLSKIKFKRKKKPGPE